jgi:membrane fusion protein (multidrug efflux system)
LSEEQKANHKKSFGNGKRWAVIAVALLLLICGALFGWRHWSWSRTHATTDDAYVHGDLATIAPRVSGMVAHVAVRHNQLVRPGEVLVRLDPTDYEVKVHQAEADLLQAENQLTQQRAAVAAAEAQLALSQARQRQAESEVKRREQLFREGVVAREQYERYRRDAEVAGAEVRAAEEELGRQRAAIGGSRALIQQREAARREARLQLAYTTISAPIAGQVTRKRVEVGNQVDVGQPMMVLVPLGHLWVEANFKETELARVRPGQRAEVKIDTYGGRLFRGRVHSIMAVTGSALSLLPPENATGNWVKVVQRIPVRIELEPGQLQGETLRVGQSAEVTIETD